MEEDEYDAEGYDETDGEEPSLEEGGGKGIAVGKLVTDELAVDEPAHHNACQESTSGQEELGGEEVTELHEGHAEETDALVGAHGEGAEYGDDGTDDGKYPGGPLAGQAEFLVEKSSAYLVHGDGGREGGKDQ